MNTYIEQNGNLIVGVLVIEEHKDCLLIDARANDRVCVCVHVCLFAILHAGKLHVMCVFNSVE